MTAATLFELAAEWLAAETHEEIGAETLLRSMPPGVAWQVTVVRQGSEISGVSVISPSRRCHLTARDKAASEILVALGRRVLPLARVVVRGDLKASVRALLLERGEIVREHDQLVMVCTATSVDGEGRWATDNDIAALRELSAAFDRERMTDAATRDLEAAVAVGHVAVLERQGSIVATARWRPATPRYTVVWGSFTVPERRRQGLGRRVTAFVVHSALAGRGAAHLVVDDDNDAAIALYRSTGFEEVGRCYVAYPA